MEDQGAELMPLVQLEWLDINGAIRGKIAPREKALSRSGTGVSTLVMSAIGSDNIAFTDWSNFENGFPKMTAMPDQATLVDWAWKPGMGSVLCDYVMDDGSPCELDSRSLLKRLADAYAELGLEPHAALEWEFYIHHADDTAMRAKDYQSLKSFGRGIDFYSLTRSPSFLDLGAEFMRRMNSIGINVEAFHTEYGSGMYEYTCSPATMVKAADDAARSKTYMRQLCADLDLVPSFMPAIHQGTGDSQSGCHHNVSVYRDGRNAFWDESTGQLSDLGRWFLGGVIESMSDFHLLFRPWVNSYRRFDKDAWNPVDASWGLDNHEVAVRLVHGFSPEKTTRLEHRVPGPDVNPYLSLGAIFWAGLHGIKNEIEPPEGCVGDPTSTGRYPELPRTFEASIETFAKSELAREFLGDKFTDLLVANKRAELDAFQTWQRAEGAEFGPDDITPWELQRYFEWC